VVTHVANPSQLPYRSNWRRDDPLAPLRNPLLPSGYHGVYPKGRNRYQAKPYRKQSIGHFATPEAAAVAVAAWWKDRYGPDWPRWFAKRKDQAWRVIRIDRPAGKVRLVATFTADGRWEAWPVRKGDRVYQAVCWIDGVRAVCFPPLHQATAYADRRSAAAGFRQWSRQNLGLFAPAVLKRCG
jgi:hypothetical protein